jgi:aminotransferase in exopolysaccharide biosynthesis
MSQRLKELIIAEVKRKFPQKGIIPLHTPVFNGNEKKYILDAIDSTFVSSVGEYVNRFETQMAEITGTRKAVAVVNGTCALHLALLVAGVAMNDEVLVQSVTFIATCNAISYINAAPVFIDIDTDSMGMSPSSLRSFLENYGLKGTDGKCYNKSTGKRIAACVPMHTFGMPCRIDEIALICAEWNIVLVEDAAESLGSYYKNAHTGSFGKLGVFSFNGNKTVTCGGGGAIITNDEELAIRAKHISTQAKVAHKWFFEHDAIGYNYRMPNINAALACAQLENLHAFVSNKRQLAKEYHQFFIANNILFHKEIEGAKSNFWLNAILFNDKVERDAFLEFSNEHGVMSRPLWHLMHKLPMFKNTLRTALPTRELVADRAVNIPSSVRI